jgi:DNA-binding transcriptional MerR regulator
MASHLPVIPAKRYFTIGEVADLCDVKPHVLRYWEQEFTQLKPMKRRGNRRYYQHHEVLMIRRIRELLYEQGFTISGARNRLRETGTGARMGAAVPLAGAPGEAAPSNAAQAASPVQEGMGEGGCEAQTAFAGLRFGAVPALSAEEVREELLQIRSLLSL